MKHPVPFTIYLIILFFSAQVIGLFIISQYVHTEVSTETGQKIVVGVKELPAGIERPTVTESASFIPIIIGVLVGTVLLLLISGYDVFAVWKSKHMIKLADFQANSKVFAGLAIPYKKQLSSKRAKAPASKLAAAAILGGGDIAFPMLFAGTLLKSFSFPQVLLVVATATMALAVLLFIAKKGRFYPAMPVLTIGCLIGYWVLLL